MASNDQGGTKGNKQSSGNKQGGGNKQSSGNKQTEGNKQSVGGGRGFASMDPQRQREIAAQGGRAAHASGNAHEFTSDEARRAGSMSHKNDDKR